MATHQRILIEGSIVRKESWKMVSAEDTRRNTSMALIVEEGIALRHQAGMAEGLRYLRSHGVPEMIVFRVLGAGRKRL